MAPVKMLILYKLYKGVLKLESFTILDVPDNVFSKVARIVIVTEKMGIRVEWIDQVIGRSVPRETTFSCSMKLDN